MKTNCTIGPSAQSHSANGDTFWMKQRVEGCLLIHGSNKRNVENETPNSALKKPLALSLCLEKKIESRGFLSIHVTDDIPEGS